MLKVLILDDRATNRCILEKLAKAIDQDLTVTSLGDPLEALEWLAVNTADLIITDYKMPNLDGAEFTKRVRANPKTADIPIIVTTIYEDRNFRLLSLEAGATDFLLSPVDGVEFKTRVRNLLALRRHQLAAKEQNQKLKVDLEASEILRSNLLRESRDALAQVINTLHAMVSATDRDGRILFVNAAQAALVGVSPVDLIGREVSEIYGADRGLSVRRIDEEIFTTGSSLRSLEETFKTPSGSHIFLHTTKAPLRDANGDITAVLTTSIDITDRKNAENRLLHLAQHDPLTDLPNRAYLNDRLRERCGHGRRTEDAFALHFLDLDRFKAVNDAMGHQMGDKLLQEAAKRLKSIVRETDVVARLGGDEFAILQQDIDGTSNASLMATRILQAFNEPFYIDDRSIVATTSLGITIYPKDANQVEVLLRNADLAMYRAKSSGRAGFRFFDEEMNAAAQQAIRLEGELRRALAQEEFGLLWQPLVSLKTGRISGAEALLRWNHSDRGVVMPTSFLNLAEETGLMAPITDWVLAAACAQGLAWSNRHPSGLRISVNLSPSLFSTRNVQEMVRGALTKSGLPPHLLDLEITEQVLLGKMDDVAATVTNLRDVGVNFSIDDFGTGYSSLAYVKSFPVQRLKVDQTFIEKIATDPSDAAIVRAVINLAHGLGMTVVAEGVETEEQISALRELGCDEVQGFFVREPVSADQLTEMIDSHQSYLPPIQ